MTEESAAQRSSSSVDQASNATLRRDVISRITRAVLDTPTKRDVRIINRTRRRRNKFPLNSTEDIARADRRLDLSLKRTVAWFAILAVTAQLTIADVIFWEYASKGQTPSWAIPTTAMQAWLAATVIEVIGILYVIARYLFPRRDGGADTAEGV